MVNSQGPLDTQAVLRGLVIVVNQAVACLISYVYFSCERFLTLLSFFSVCAKNF